jgi:uncharacterized protein YuzE
MAGTDAALRIDYDEDADVLYMSFGPPREAVGIEVEPGIVCRMDLDTQMIVGVTIEHFRARFGGDRVDELFELAESSRLCPLPEEIREYAYS